MRKKNQPGCACCGATSTNVSTVCCASVHQVLSLTDPNGPVVVTYQTGIRMGGTTPITGGTLTNGWVGGYQINRPGGPGGSGNQGDPCRGSGTISAAIRYHLACINFGSGFNWSLAAWVKWCGSGGSLPSDSTLIPWLWDDPTTNDSSGRAYSSTQQAASSTCTPFAISWDFAIGDTPTANIYGLWADNLTIFTVPITVTPP